LLLKVLYKKRLMRPAAIRHRLLAFLCCAALALASTAPLQAAPATPPANAFADITAPLEIVVERDPSRLAAAMRLARLQVETGQWDAAWRVLERSAPYAGKDAEYQGFAGTVLRQLKRAPEAAEAYRRAISLQPDEGRWWFGLGLALESAGRKKEAKLAFAAARERERTLSPVLLKLLDRQAR
jgi:Flp pilus assembly protein TadD